MLRRVVRSVARRSYRALPQSLRQRVQSRIVKRSYAANTDGLVADPQMQAWAARHSRAVSIVIPSYNDFDLLSACIASLARTTSHLDYEVIVVDDYCEHDNSERLKSLRSDRVRVIFKEERQGFAVSVNIGMGAVAADRDIVLLNSDIVALPGWLDALMYSAYALDPKIGMVSPRLLYPNGTIQYGGTYYARVLAPQWFGHLYVGSRPDRAETSVPWYNRSISGACVYVKRDTYEILGGLDEQYWLGFEDVDYGLSAWDKGIRCYYQPQSTLIHHESASRGYSQGARELASMRLFWSRWASKFLQRTLDDSYEVEFIVSNVSDASWHRYVSELADRLSDGGLATRLHEVKAGAADESLVAELNPRSSIKVCCDWGAQATAWLGSLSNGKAVYMLPELETLGFSNDRMQQAEIVAGYRPEFDYIAPNRWTAAALTAEAAWEVQHRVVPVLEPSLLDDNGPDAMVAVIGGTQEQRSLIESVARDHNVKCEFFDDLRLSTEEMSKLTSARPKIVISFAEYRTSMVPLVLMSVGAAYIGVVSDQTKYEVLDGYNMLAVQPGALETVTRSLTDVLVDDDVRRSLAQNGRRTAEALFNRNTDDITSAFHAIARTAV